MFEEKVPFIFEDQVSAMGMRYRVADT